jgi:hypothetical protein
MLQSYCGLPRSLLCDSSFPFFSLKKLFERSSRFSLTAV